MQYEQQADLGLASRHVADGEARVTQQTALIRELMQDGHDTTNAEALLQTLKETLALMYTHLETLTRFTNDEV